MPHFLMRKIMCFVFALCILFWGLPVALAQNANGLGIPAPEPIPEFTLDNDGEPDLEPEGEAPSGFARVDMPAILYDLASAPRPVARMHALLSKAALSGNIEALRPLVGTGTNTTQLSLSGFDGDPIEYLRGLSGDEQGHEMLAIILDILDSGFVRLDEGTDAEIYVWPYFAAGPLTELQPTQMVELFRIITSGDFEDMKAFGAYNFYRLGITPQGQWKFFVAGD